MKKNLRPALDICSCGSGQSYDCCCGPWHKGLASDVHAPTPEALMRSRYSAFVLGLADYLLATWHPSTTPDNLVLAPVKWLGLEVRHTQTDGDVGVVEFVARAREGGRVQRLHETSRFARQSGRWYYIDGQMAEAA